VLLNAVLLDAWLPPLSRTDRHTVQTDTVITILRRPTGSEEIIINIHYRIVAWGAKYVMLETALKPAMTHNDST